MTVIARRLTIIVLTMTVFALGLATLVTAPGRREIRVHLDSGIECYHPATPGCIAAL